MEKETQYARIRERLHITLSPESHERVKNNPTNTSRLIDSPINGVKKGIKPVYVFFFVKTGSKQMGLVGFEPTIPAL